MNFQVQYILYTRGGGRLGRFAWCWAQQRVAANGKVRRKKVRVFWGIYMWRYIYDIHKILFIVALCVVFALASVRLWSSLNKDRSLFIRLSVNTECLSCLN